MADEADRAEAEEERFRQQALAIRKRTLIPTGYCHYCGETVRAAHLFCDFDCGASYEAERAIRDAQGR